MTDDTIIEMVCEHCGAVNRLTPGHGLRELGLCSRCMQLLYELDDQNQRIRITKKFRTLYQELRELWSTIQRDLGAINQKLRHTEQMASSSNTGSLAEIFSAVELVTNRSLQIMSALQNENSISDPETRTSMEEFLPLLHRFFDEVPDRIEKLTETREEEKAIAIYDEWKKMSKDASTFFHLMDKYLGNRLPAE